MYSYCYDPETGGILLQKYSALKFKEPRPVYAGELDLLGFNNIYTYDSQNDIPYMWAEENIYWYRGEKIARILGGNLFEKPTIVLEKNDYGRYILPPGCRLIPVDIIRMVKKNYDMIATIEMGTKRKVYNIFSYFRSRYDIFRLSFSGGKDSMVLLDILKDTIPRNKFIVLFCDTTMELPHTYKFISHIERIYNESGIRFHIAKSNLDAGETWELFGPPSRVLRWCCSVHKSAPMVLQMRHLNDAKNTSEFVFVGVRANESATRRNYRFLERNRKIHNQVTCNAILDWNSAEVWLYTYFKQLPINEAYKFGNQRVGCLLCPMSLKTDYIKNQLYPQEMGKFITILRKHFSDEDIINGYWCSRTNGDLLKDNPIKVYETIKGENYILTIESPANVINDWLEIINDHDLSHVNISKCSSGYKLNVRTEFYMHNRKLISKLKNVFFKTAFCKGCGVCAANCKKNAILFANKIYISGCVGCQACNMLDYGCLIYNSRRASMKRIINNCKSRNRYGTHAPKNEWLSDFFALKDNLFDSQSSNLGTVQIEKFRAFLMDADLYIHKTYTPFMKVIASLGWNSPIASGLLLVNLSYTPQFSLYVKKLLVGKIFSRQEFINTLLEEGISELDSKRITAAFKRFSELPFCQQNHWARVSINKGALATLCRTKPTPPDERVYLYGLYKFAQALGGGEELPLERLMDFTTESTAISPSEIFALSREETCQYLRGLAHNYPEFVLDFTTTHGLELLYLNPEKTAADVLALF